MKTYFPPEFFAGNRQRLRKLFTGQAPIVISANALLQRNSDIAMPFRQDSSFWYLTGINEPEVILVIDKAKEYLIVPERHDIRNIFDGTIDVEALRNRSGIDEIIDSKTGWKRLRTRLKRVKHVATLPASPRYIEAYEFYTNPARASLIERLKSHAPELQLLDLKDHLTKLRMVKQPEEIASLQASVDLTVKTFNRLHRQLSKFSYEYEVEAFITKEFLDNGAKHGYAPIIASGANACVLHYDSNHDKLNSDTLLLIDSGAEVEYYSADITRTYGLNRVSKRQQQVHSAVQEVQQYAIANLKPGISIRENELTVEQLMGEKLRELGLIKSIDKDSVRKYFSHATSHFLGLDIHDIADYEKPLEPNMVLTVEPGVYIPEEALGIRLEDDVIITKDGCKNLSAGLPSSLS